MVLLTSSPRRGLLVRRLASRRPRAAASPLGTFAAAREERQQEPTQCLHRTGRLGWLPTSCISKDPPNLQMKCPRMTIFFSGVVRRLPHRTGARTRFRYDRRTCAHGIPRTPIVRVLHTAYQRGGAEVPSLSFPVTICFSTDGLDDVAMHTCTSACSGQTTWGAPLRPSTRQGMPPLSHLCVAVGPLLTATRRELRDVRRSNVAVSQPGYRAQPAPG